MGRKITTFLTALSRRPTLLSIAAAVVALGSMQRESRAGVIVPLAQAETLAAAGLPCDAPASSSAAVESVLESGKRPSDDGRSPRVFALEGLAETGGASAPTSSGSGPATAVAVAVLDAPVIPRVTCSYRALREHRVRLPQPPPGELLDPPKAG